MKNSKFRITFFLISILIFNIEFLSFAFHVKADTNIDSGFVYLKSQQDDTGRIKNGFSAPSQWSAIAFASNGIDISTISATPTSSSLLNFLETDIPSSESAATDWESRILAIVGINYNPTKFNDVNYVQNLENFYNTNGYLGDYCSFNGDIFGLLALISAGPAADTTAKQNILNFIISKQDGSGGFSWLTDASCSTQDYPYAVSADMTGAAVVALVEAKNHGLVAEGLDNAVASASAYLTKNQDIDGGWVDTDTTGWVLQGFNALGLVNSTIAGNAKNYLTTSPQLGSDNGITDCQWNSATNSCDFISNATTTAQALIALSGKDWIIKIFDPSSANSTPPLTDTPSPTPTVTPTVTPTSTTNSNSSSNNPTNTPTPTPILIPTSIPTEILLAENQLEVSPTEAVLGSSITTDVLSPTPALSVKVSSTSLNWSFLSKFLIVLGIIFFITCGILIVKRHKELN